MPIRMMREYAKLRHQGMASAGRRKQILIEQRTEVLGRIAELNSCLDVLNYKITNYEQCEQAVVIEPAAASA
jgi:hypothetical protein